MRLIFRNGEASANLSVDSVEIRDDTLLAFRKPEGGAKEFAAFVSLGSVDFAYLSEQHGGGGEEQRL